MRGRSRCVTFALFGSAKVDLGMAWGWGGLGTAARMVGEKGAVWSGQAAVMEQETESQEGLETGWVWRSLTFIRNFLTLKPEWPGSEECHPQDRKGRGAPGR